MMWNPPWAATAVLPLGLLPAREAQLLWLVVHLLVTWFCGDRLWLLLGGSRPHRWIGWALSFAFLPTVFAFSAGQIAPFLLLGAVLFLECERRGWQYLAGAATVLVAIKPHLAYLLWVALAVDAVARGRWRALVGGAAVGLACSALPLAFDPQLLHQYADAMGNRPPGAMALAHLRYGSPSGVRGRAVPAPVRVGRGRVTVVRVVSVEKAARLELDRATPRSSCSFRS